MSEERVPCPRLPHRNSCGCLVCHGNNEVYRATADEFVRRVVRAYEQELWTMDAVSIDEEI